MKRLGRTRDKPEPGKLSVTNARMHGEMARVWLDIDRDPEVRVAILRGEGRGFSAGGRRFTLYRLRAAAHLYR